MNKPKKTQLKSNKQGAIRIISGKYRGRKLPVLDAEGLRPTTDRVKETVFNWLMPYIQESICLDCFAGSGGLGFEALSRGATSVTFIELNKQAATQLKANIKLLKADNAQVINKDAIAYLASPPTPYNLVFIDPPFRKDIIASTITAIENGWLSENALIYTEMESDMLSLSIPPKWQQLKAKQAGQVTYALYQVNNL